PPAAVVAPLMPRALVRGTAEAAAVMAGGGGGAGPAGVLSLVTGGVWAMGGTKLKPLGLSALTAGVLIAGAVGLSGQTPGGLTGRGGAPPRAPPRGPGGGAGGGGG